ncbi:MAG: MFS transporter [Thermomicrobiales bacterium]|nr:MFS transporter [Thermomicrobiales bacterium]MCO5218079.1 MFS transporter [Thermomicrobiales bacterium]MCO5226056.1 MFS transporter [Thermomicrobiales bacterium]MCO5227195.1 MFS transporter [Thermomicrobiales bacterium]
MATLLTIDQLTSAQRQRGLIALMTGTFFSWGGFFMVIPLMAVHYVDHLGWAAGTIGIILAVRQFMQQGFTTIFGILADRVGPRVLIAAGMFTRAIGFVVMGFAESFAFVLGAAMVVAIGGSMFESPIQAAVAALTYPDERRRYYARIGMISGLGTTVGTQIGAFLIGYNFRQVCLGGAAAFLTVAFIVTFALPSVAASVGTESAMSGVRQVLGDTLFLRYVVIVAGYWFAWTQFGLTITLAAVELTGSDRAVSWIYLVNAAVTIALGYALPRVLERWLTPLQMQIAGVATIGLGLMAVGFSSGFSGVLIAAAIFAIGAVMARPGQETVLANLALPSARGTYFGVAALALAVGGGLGNYLGGVIYDIGGGAASPLPWTIFGGVAMVTAVLLWINRVRFSVVRA